MESVRQSCRPKHQVLTLKCYPRYQKGVSEVKPNPSELSYLLYYTSTRRSKLTKVGAFLEKRVAKDVWRRRLGNVQVALHILTALIEKVPRDLPIYARSVLTILETILQSNDISLVEDSLATFETFCLHQDIATIAAEQGIAQKYREVVRSYASFAHPSHSSTKTSPAVAIRWRNAGLRAIKSLVSSESLAADGGTTLKIILPVILENLYSAEENVLVILKERLHEPEKPERDGNRNRRLSVATVHTVDTAGDPGDPALAAQSTADVDRQAELNARLLALRCLEKIVVSGSNRGQIRFAVATILEFISTKRSIPQTPNQIESNTTHDGNWATSLVDLIANWCPVQVRFVILVTAMDILLETNPKEDALDSTFTILSVIDWLLKSSVNMIGLSVMDILLGFIQYVTKVLSPDPEPEKNTEHTSERVVAISAERKALLGLMEQCIGNLATHIYYGDQIADMMRAILRRFKPNTNHESAAPSTLATVHEGGVAPADSNQPAETNGEKANGGVLTHSAAKLTCLRAVKAILTVANLRTPATTTGSESRNAVGIYVWEGTQSLLRDPDQEVRFAYTDAFLSWLNLETNKNDLKARVDTPKYIKSTSKRESDLNRRTTSAPGNQGEIVALAAQSSFLRLLHLSIYDAAIESAAVTSDVLLLHLLLYSLVENLGVNAVQFGLPMVLKLQHDLFTSVDFRTSTGRVNIGSLVHGYLLAISEKFNIESTQAGVEICHEVEKRRKNGHWLAQVRLPPTGIDGIAVPNEKIGDDNASIDLSFFQNTDGLVGAIDESYSQAISSPPQSPPTSPARGFNFPVLSHTSAVPPSQIESGLPSPIKEQLLSSWSREACLAAVEKESVKTLSLSGSRGGTLARNSPANGAANGSPAGSASNKNRRMSVPEISHTSEPDSSRGSPVRVTELRRALSVNTENPRKRSPLRGQVDASNMSDVSDDSESMVSGNFSVSEVDGDVASIQPHEGLETTGEDGMETPRASASAIALGADKKPPTLSRTNSDDIPPVPPIPPTLSIPGGFPNDSQRSLLLERPSTAPDSHQSSFKGKSELNAPKTRNKHLSRDKSRSNNSLATGINNAFNSMDSNGDTPLDGTQRDELRNLLDGFLAPEGSILANGDRQSAKAPLDRSYSRRHVSGGGIGRPPY